MSWASSFDRLFLPSSLTGAGLKPEGASSLLPQEEPCHRDSYPRPHLRGSLHGRILFDSSFKIEMHSWAASFMCRWVVGVDGPHRSEDLFFMWLSLAIKCEGNTRERERERACEEGRRPCLFFLLHPSQWREDKLRVRGCLAGGFGSELMWGDAKLGGPCGLLGGPEIWGTGSPCWLAWWLQETGVASEFPCVYTLTKWSLKCHLALKPWVLQWDLAVISTLWPLLRPGHCG